MRGVVGYLLAAIVLAIAGAVAQGASRYESVMADAQERLVTLDYAGASEKLDDAQHYVGYATWIPRLGDEAMNDLRTRQASVHYWERQYDAILPAEQAIAGTLDAAESADLRLIVANAAYRVGQGTAKDKASTIRSLDEAIASYLTVLKGDQWQEHAAYNYEYLIRLRDDLAKSRRSPPPEQKANGSNGTAGAPGETADTKKFEIYVPLTGSERTKSGEAGKAEPNKRKG